MCVCHKQADPPAVWSRHVHVAKQFLHRAGPDPLAGAAGAVILSLPHAVTCAHTTRIGSEWASREHAADITATATFGCCQLQRRSDGSCWCLGCVDTLTVVADALPGLPRWGLASRGGVALASRPCRRDCAVGTEDAPTDSAVVPPHQHAEGCFALIARLALAVVDPVVLGGCCLVSADSCNYLGEKLLHELCALRLQLPQSPPGAAARPGHTGCVSHPGSVVPLWRMHRSKQGWLIEHLQIVLMLVGNPAAGGAWQGLPCVGADRSAAAHRHHHNARACCCICLRHRPSALG